MSEKTRSPKTTDKKIAFDETTSVRERLILAAIKEVDEVGFERFSARRAAETSGVSCAAPYKHFKNKRGYLEAIIEYIVDVWLARQEVVLERYKNESTRLQLLELALEYIRFMVENPRYRAILMIRDDAFDSSFLAIKSKISERSKIILAQYCQESGMSSETARVKMYIVRSFIYGAALMFGNGELQYDAKTFHLVRLSIDREFDLPPLVEKN